MPQPERINEKLKISFPSRGARAQSVTVKSTVWGFDPHSSEVFISIYISISSLWYRGVEFHSTRRASRNPRNVGNEDSTLNLLCAGYRTKLIYFHSKHFHSKQQKIKNIFCTKAILPKSVLSKKKN